MNFPIPKKVAQNALTGLELRKTYKRGGTSVGINMARLLVRNYQNGKGLSLPKIYKISQYFPRHAKDNLHQTNPPSNGLIAWLLWGGDEGWKWSEGIKKKVGKYV